MDEGLFFHPKESDTTPMFGSFLKFHPLKKGEYLP